MEIEKTPQFEIRKATRDDTSALRQMHAQSWLATYPSEENGVSYEWVKERTNRWLTPEGIEESKGILGKVLDDPNQFYRLAEKDGEIVGFVHIATNDDGTNELQAIYVSPAMFGSGLGHQLMTLADEWIDGIQITLDVATYNDRAIRFYEKNGFTKIEGTEYLYKDVIPVIKMVRKGDRT